MYQCAYRHNYQNLRSAVSMMARREQSQFDDAFEDAESDMLTSKTLPPTSHTPYIQRNGHLSSGREEDHDGTNGELPESDAATEDTQEERAEGEWNGLSEGIKGTRIMSDQIPSPEEDGQDEYGDTFFINQSDTGLQGIGYGSAYQYSEGDDGTREGTEDSGQGQMRDDLTESDKDKDYMEDATQERQGVAFDPDDQYEDSGVVDDNGMIDMEGGMQGYEAEEDHIEGEDRFEEVDFRYDYMDGNSFLERQPYGDKQSYAESQPYVEDNPAFNESEPDYDTHRDYGQKQDIYQDYTESDLPESGPNAASEFNEASRVDTRFDAQQSKDDEQMPDYHDNHSRVDDHSQLTGDYVIVDQDVFGPESNSNYAASDSVEADQEEPMQSNHEDFDYRNTSSHDVSPDVQLFSQSLTTVSGGHEGAEHQASMIDATARSRNEGGYSDSRNLGQHKRVKETGLLDPVGERKMPLKSTSQMRVSPKQGGSPAQGVKEPHTQVPRRPAPGAAQSVQKIPPSFSSSRGGGQSPVSNTQGYPGNASSPVSGPQDNSDFNTGKRRVPRSTTQTSRDGTGNQERRSRPEGSGRPLGGDRPRSMPLPGGAQPVSVLKSRLQKELREMNDIEKNLASTSIQPEINRTLNSNDNRRDGGDVSPGDCYMSSRHNAEYASVSSLRSSPASQRQTSPSDRVPYARDPLPGRDMSRSPSSSPEKMKAARPARREPPRNNSNANHLESEAVTRRPKHNSRPQDHSKRYSYEIEEKSDAASGEIVFDDIAECGAYLDEKDAKPSPIKIKNRQGKTHAEDTDSLGGRRRRNSYELANRSSSEEEENEQDGSQKTNKADSGGLSSLVSQGGGLLGSGQRGTGMNSSLLSQLAERELANLRNSYKKPQEEVQDSQQESHSVTSDTSSTSSTHREDQSKVLPKLSPMEYDAVGFRLAGHAGIGESTLNLSAVQQQAHPEEDQFSDAEEDGSDPPLANPAITPSRSFNTDHPSPVYGRSRSMDDPRQGTSPLSSPSFPHPPSEETCAEQVDVNAAMKELHSALTNSKTKLMKAPSFYTPEQKPIWILQPDAAKKHEDDQKRTRVLEDRRRRNEEMRRSHVQQRAEYMKHTGPQCYVRNDEDEEGEDEDKGLMSEQDQKMGAPDYLSKQRTAREQETMRAPDLPPTTGKIKEARGPHDETALGRGIIYPAAYLGSTQLVTTKQPTKKVRMQQAQEAVNRIKVSRQCSYAYARCRARCQNKTSRCNSPLWGVMHQCLV
ncbi:uncharacterized protein [Diadema antillarum]|uniref:uncharacterized protein isoform X1 n=1 Tax=Diadema antillarum TaxID=105358 RepID=UPI003A877299